MAEPGMRRTGWADLVVPFVVFGVTAYVLLRFSYAALPPLQWVVVVPLVALGVVEMVLARRVRAAVRHDTRAKAMTAIAIARCVALGKASSLVAAGVAGAALGLVVRLLPDVGTVRAAAADARVGGLLLVAAVFVTVAGLLVERAGVDPNAGRRDD